MIYAQPLCFALLDAVFRSFNLRREVGATILHDRFVELSDLLEATRNSIRQNNASLAIKPVEANSRWRLLSSQRILKLKDQLPVYCVLII
ncbi:hypothetical protein TSO352_13340 [Azospirillum sp. TSO35-2]|nr:hypothetical protein TSO352_13340 [Azospirillum sp. TSO35-2]